MHDFVSTLPTLNRVAFTVVLDNRFHQSLGFSNGGAMVKPVLLDVPMPVLTPRLQIRPRFVGEGPVLTEAVRESLESLRPWMPFAQVEPQIENFEEHCRRALANFILRADFSLSIYDRSGGQFIGSTGLHRINWDARSFEIGYWVRASCEGKGFVSEAANALTRYAFQVFNANRVEIRCDSRNLRSLAVMKRLGFIEEGHFKNDDMGVDGKPRDTLITARTNMDGLPALEVSWGANG